MDQGIAELSPRLSDAEVAEWRREAATALIARHERVIRRTARRYSSCADDAEDAYQRAVEILLCKAPLIEPERLVRWMHTVTRHEAYAVRRQRGRGLETSIVETDDGLEVDALDLVPSESPEPAEESERSERIARSREALKALKPHEVRALTLKAEGYSYTEIGEMTGWSRTKINRLMVEGRRRFLDVFADIEEGRRCEQLAGALSSFADGEIGDTERTLLMEHLAQCAHCRAKLRAYRGVPHTVLQLAPVMALGGTAGGRGLSDRFVAGLDRAREVAASILHRGPAVEASQAVAAGGPRGGGLAVLGVVCGLGAAGGGAAVCVDNGIVDNPFEGQSPISQEKPAAEVQPTAVEAAAQTVPSVAPPPEPEPIQTPARQREREFGFEGSATAGSGGGTSEFGGAPAGGGTSSGGGAGAGGFGFEK